MAKQTVFSQPAFPIRVLVPLVAILCSITGTLLCIPPAYAATPLIVIFNNLGGAKSATVFYHSQPLGACLQASSIVTDNPATDRIAGYLSGAGIFSVDFYSTDDCSGPREQFHRYQFQGVPGGLIVCNSDTQCFSNTLTSAPSDLHDPIPSVLVQWLNNAQGFNIQANGTVQGGCITKNNIQNRTNMLSFPVNGGGTFVATFYSDNTCKSPTQSFTFSSPKGTDGGFVTCTPDQQCSCSGCTLVSPSNSSSVSSIPTIQGIQVRFPSDQVPSSGNKNIVYLSLANVPNGYCLSLPTDQWLQFVLPSYLQGMKLAVSVYSDSSCGQKIADVALPIPSTPVGGVLCYYNFTPSSKYSFSGCVSPTQFITPNFYNSPSSSSVLSIQGLKVFFPADHVPSSGNRGTVYLKLNNVPAGDFPECLAFPTNQWNQLPLEQPIQLGMNLTVSVYSNASCRQKIADVVLPMPSTPVGDGMCYYNFTPSSGYSFSDCVSPTQFITPNFYNSSSRSSASGVHSLKVFVPSNLSTVYARVDFNGLSGGLAGCQPIPANRWHQLTLKRPLQPQMEAELFVFSDPSCKPQSLVSYVTLQMPSSLSNMVCSYNFSSDAFSDCIPAPKTIAPRTDKSNPASVYMVNGFLRTDK